MKGDIERVIAYGHNAVMFNSDKKQDFIAVFKRVFNIDTCSNCPGDIYNNYFKLKKLDSEKLKIMAQESKAKFKLKDGIVLDTHFGDGVKIPCGHWTNSNITDEIAEKLIKNGKYGKYFLNADGSAIDTKEDDETKLDIDGDGKPDLSAKEMKAILIEKGIPADDVKNMKSPALIALFKEKGFELK